MPLAFALLDDPSIVDAGRSPGRVVGRLVLAAIMIIAAVGHFAYTSEFRAQVPPWFPARDAVVYASGVIELGFGVALLATKARTRVVAGLALASFFVVIFPGNVSQYVTRTYAFGLDSDAKRLIRLIFQPPLVLLALWSTGATSALVRWRRERAGPRRNPRTY